MNARVARSLTEMQNKEDLSELFDDIEKTAEMGGMSIFATLTEAQFKFLLGLGYKITYSQNTDVYTIIW